MIRQSKSPSKQTTKTQTKGNAGKTYPNNHIKKPGHNKDKQLDCALSRYEVFVNEYIKDFNATQAYIRAGIRGKSPEVNACNLLRNPKVQELLAIAKAERIAAIKVDANYVLQRHLEIDQMDCLDILEDDGSIKAIKDWPKIWRQFISGFEITELLGGRGDEKQMIGLLKKIKWPDKTKNLELIGKHTTVQAYRDQIGISNPTGGPIEHKVDWGSLDPIEASKLYQQTLG